SMKEIEELFLLIEFLKSDGKAVLFISHKFDEIYRIADRYTVFRDGEMVGEGLLKDTGQNEIVRMMVGRNVDHIFPQREPKIGAPVLSVSGLSHPTEFDDIGFELRKGEILGFYGLVGAGRSEVMQAIAGITRASRGTISLDGTSIAPKSAADSIEAGIVYVPEERGKQGVVIGLPIFQNLSLPSLARTSKSGVLRLAEEFSLARSYTGRLDLRASSLSQDVGTLSGGNQQKVVIAKWLATAPKVIILDEPTKGIDIGSKAAVHGFMAELVAQGLSVIMVSSELPEILGMSDRVVVMREGRIAATYDNKGLDAETLVRTAAGIAA
ncbi:MAG: sugar ABC transporter ATP-binding protein, partial [Mesorhizobium sp.]